MRIAIADLPGPTLDAAVAELRAGGADVVGVPTDVADPDQVRRLEATVLDRFGGLHLVMNNAGIQPGSQLFGADEVWHRILDVNFWGIANGSRILVPGMIARGEPGMVINTGSKQGITTPPGDPAYNVSKAAAKAFTEALEHELRNTAGGRISAHLLIPGFVYTPLTKGNRTEKPAGAWTPEETADFMMARLAAGDFYVLCPDNDVTRAIDERRIAWAAGDIIENRPPLSRWHPDYGEAFKAYLERR